MKPNHRQLRRARQKSDSINRLKVDLGDKTAAIFSLGAEKSSRRSLQRPRRTLTEDRRVAEADGCFGKPSELANVSADSASNPPPRNPRVEATALRVRSRR